MGQENLWTFAILHNSSSHTTIGGSQWFWSSFDQQSQASWSEKQAGEKGSQGTMHKEASCISNFLSKSENSNSAHQPGMNISGKQPKNEMEVQVRRCKQTFSCWIQIDMYTARQICSFLSLKFTRVQLHHPAPIQRVHNRIKRPTAEESDQENWVLTQTWTLNFSVVPFLCWKTWI